MNVFQVSLPRRKLHNTSYTSGGRCLIVVHLQQPSAVLPSDYFNEGFLPKTEKGPYICEWEVTAISTLLCLSCGCFFRSNKKCSHIGLGTVKRPFYHHFMRSQLELTTNSPPPTVVTNMYFHSNKQWGITRICHHFGIAGGPMFGYFPAWQHCRPSAVQGKSAGCGGSSCWTLTNRKWWCNPANTMVAR